MNRILHVLIGLLVISALTLNCEDNNFKIIPQKAIYPNFTSFPGISASSMPSIIPSVVAFNDTGNNYKAAHMQLTNTLAAFLPALTLLYRLLPPAYSTKPIKKTNGRYEINYEASIQIMPGDPQLHHFQVRIKFEKIGETILWEILSAEDFNPFVLLLDGNTDANAEMGHLVFKAPNDSHNIFTLDYDLNGDDVNIHATFVDTVGPYYNFQIDYTRTDSGISLFLINSSDSYQIMLDTITNVGYIDPLSSAKLCWDNLFLDATCS